MLKRLQQQRRSPERGVITLEFVGTFAIVLGMVLIVWQGMLAMHALTETNYAARDAARAEVLINGSGSAAGENALSSHLREGSSITCETSSDAVTCQAEVRIPLITSTVLGGGIHEPTVTRSATMPDTGEVNR